MLVGFFLDVPNFWLVINSLKISAFKLMLGLENMYVYWCMFHISDKEKNICPTLWEKYVQLFIFFCNEIVMMIFYPIYCFF
jgi:hypothetical protein